MSRTVLHRLWLALGAIACLHFALQAQNQQVSQARETALRFLQSNPIQFNLSPEDVSDVRVTDAYVTKHNGVTHVWVQQQYAGIPVYNALFGLHVKPDGSVLHLGHRFIPNLAKQVNTTLPSLGAARALELAMQNLEFAGFQVPGVKRKIDDHHWIFETGAISRTEIPVQICFTLDDKGQPRLAWDVAIDQANTSDVWTIQVDAQTGKILNKYNHTLYCGTGHAQAAAEMACEDQTGTVQVAAAPLTSGADETYNVFPLPTESPAHGPRVLLTNPADPTASPFGWLDLNGVAGAEYTYTRGNNVWAYDDSGNDNTGAADESADGGANLNFDFPFNPDAEPETNLTAAITNLFYMNNMMHDITYRYGFDEEAGNYQTNNYGHSGAAGDFVNAQAIDGSGTDNANFTPSVDGVPGRMQMYKWSRQGSKIVQINSPGAVAGRYAANLANNWGGAVTTTPITGDAVFTDDGTGSEDATKNCNPAVNNLQGKIALVDRGVCEFGRKALNAESSGAIACIICGVDEQSVSMGAGAVGAQVTIPALYMTKSQCDLFRQYAGNNLNISLVIPPAAGPDFLDGDVDNGIIAHEYTHGISTRLTGGPNTAGCLGNAENMGEGWSDFLALTATVKPGDTGPKKRGVGTYVFRQPNDGQGLRRYPYSTDMSIDPLTFADVATNTETHALGEVWTTMVWDLYWAMVEQYGYDANLKNAASGNFRAVQLVMDGMKLQPCSPGFVDGRDAILAADIMNYSGADTCLISTVFARRGLGYNASQGKTDNASDGIESFEPIPLCVKQLKIKKETSTPLITAGEDIHYTITVTNHKDNPVTGVVITDPLPAGLTLGSASNGGFNNNGTVTWNLGTLVSGQVVVLTYTAKSNPANKSLLFYRDDMEQDVDNWISLVNNDKGSLVFYLQTDSVKVGTSAWKADNQAVVSDQVLIHYDPTIQVVGANPVLRFWHNYNTEKGADAGFLEFQVSGESIWRRFAPDKVFRSGYSAAVQYGTFATPNISGFSGNSNGWVRSYFDLSDYSGKTILYRFRFGSDDNTAPANGGWVVDQVDMLDMINYDTEACATSAEGDQVCASVPERGVIVDTDATVGTKDPEANDLGLSVQPNPAADVLTLRIGKAAQGNAQVTLVGADGRVALQQHVNNLYAGQVITLDVQSLPAGLYVVRVEGSTGSSVAKVAIR